jgi:O-antigen/teichoic acid export membrane protein
MKRISFLWLSPALTAFGKRFGIDSHYYAKNGAFVAVGHAMTVVRGFVTGYIVARFFDQEVYGQYQFMLSVLGTFSVFALSGMSHSVTRAWARGDSFSLWGVIKPQLSVSLIVSVILLGSIPFLGRFGREEFTSMFVAAALLFPLAPTAMVRYGGYTVGKARFDLALTVTTVSSVLMVLITGAIIAFNQSALLMLIAAMAVTPLVQFAYSRGIKPPEAEGKPDNTQGIVRYAWQLTFATLPSDLVWYLDKLLISYFFGLNQLALFSVALLIPEQAKVFAKQFFPITFAKQAANGDSRSRRMHLLRICLAGAGFIGAGILIYILAAPWAMPVLFPGYDPDQLILLTSISALTLITIPAGLLTQYLEAQGMIWEVRWSTWIATGVFAVSLVLLVPTMGPLGAVLARGVFRFANCGVAAWYVFTSPIRINEKREVT